MERGLEEKKMRETLESFIHFIIGFHLNCTNNRAASFDNKHMGTNLSVYKEFK